jgi:hypothetical protein
MDMALLNTADRSEDGSWMDVLDLDWETPLGCSILVKGPDSKDALILLDEEERFNQKRLVDSYANKKGTPDPEVSADKAIRKAVRMTKGWQDMEWAGEAFPFTEENAIKLYTKVPHIRTQVLTYYRDRVNFTTPEYASWRKRFGDGSSSTTPAKEE